MQELSLGSMKITAIDSIHNRPGRYRLSIDNKPLGYVTAEDIFELGLVLGRAIAKPVYDKVVHRITYNQHYFAAIAYADRRLRSRAEVMRYLRGRGCTLDNANAIVQKLKQLGIIDETKLAEAFVQDTLNLKPLSRRALVLKLKTKQLDPKLIEQSISAAGYDDESALEQLVRQKKARYAGKQDRFFRYLLRQGFAYNDIVKAIGKPEFKRRPPVR